MPEDSCEDASDFLNRLTRESTSDRDKLTDIHAEQMVKYEEAYRPTQI